MDTTKYSVIRRRGEYLEEGDTIKVWWSNQETDGNWDVITELETPKQTLRDCFPQGYRFGYFRGNRTGMTIPNDDIFEVRRLDKVS